MCDGISKSITAGSTMKAIYIDVDDTLVRSSGSKRIPIAGVVALIPDLKAAGVDLYCWSKGGAEYARNTAKELGIAEHFTAFLPKPDLLVDDTMFCDWGIIELHPNEFRSMDVDKITAAAILGVRYK